VCRIAIRMEAPGECQPHVDINQIRGHGGCRWWGRADPAFPCLPLTGR
jgi:hypothetical protein